MAARAKDMRKTLKKYFIPHADNNYHPHILHTKRAIFYSALFLGIKIIVIGAIAVLPLRVFVMPDVLAEQGRKIIALVNELRAQKDLPLLAEVGKLNGSAQAKADDMAMYKYFSHTSPQGVGLSYFLGQTGYDYAAAGENLAMGFSDGAELVNAWIKSPAHYENLIDKDWQEFGVGMEGGEYDGLPTVYVAQYYGRPIASVSVPEATPSIADKENAIIASKPRMLKTKEVASAKIVQNKSAVGVKQAKQEIVFNRAKSKIFWMDNHENTKLFVRAEIDGPVQSATVSVNNYPIELKHQSNNLYEGELVVQEKVDNFFRVVLSPTITITAQNGAIVKDNIDWNAIKVVSQTPWQKYLRAKSLLDNVMPIFSASRLIYLIFMVFFGTALALNIFIEIRKQHPHIILQTIALLVLLASLWMF